MNCPQCTSENPDTAAYCSECGARLEHAERESAVVDTGTLYCHVHPDTETALRCGSCERPICVKCVVQHPVGIRCRECAQLRALPQFDVPTRYYARAVGTGIGIAIAGALVLVLLLAFLPLGILGLAGLVGIGYLIGEGISRAVNRKLSRGLQYIAGGSVFLAYLLPGFAFAGLYGLLALGAAVYMAVNRLRTH